MCQFVSWVAMPRIGIEVDEATCYALFALRSRQA